MTRIRVKTRKRRHLRESASNVIALPRRDESIVADFLRYHVLVRVHDGDCDAWLAQLEACGAEEREVRFARLIRSRVRRNPALLVSIRRMVDATPFWRAFA